MNPFTPKSDFIDFTLSNARQFYSSKGDPLGVKGLKTISLNLFTHKSDLIDFTLSNELKFCLWLFPEIVSHFWKCLLCTGQFQNRPCPPRAFDFLKT